MDMAFALPDVGSKCNTWFELSPIRDEMKAMSRQRDHGVALISLAHAHYWVQHAVPGQSLQLPRRFTRHPRALQLKRHNIAGGKKFWMEFVALLLPVSDHAFIFEKPR
jgi:hypothetical protein